MFLITDWAKWLKVQWVTEKGKSTKCNFTTSDMYFTQGHESTFKTVKTTGYQEIKLMHFYTY